MSSRPRPFWVSLAEECIIPFMICGPPSCSEACSLNVGSSQCGSGELARCPALKCNPTGSLDVVCGSAIAPCRPQFKDASCMLQIDVLKVVITRKRQAGPVVSWLTGRQQFLYVEIIWKTPSEQSRRTSSGVLVSNNNGFPGAVSQEVWAWGNQEADMEKPSGERLAMKCLGCTELKLRVIGHYQDWSSAKAPLEMLGEACFQIDEDVVPAMFNDGALSLPLLMDGRIRGMVNLVVQARAESLAPVLPSGDTDLHALDAHLIPVTERRVCLRGHMHVVSCCAVFPCGTRVLTGSLDGTAIIWATSGEQISVLHGHSDGIISCAIFRSGEQLVTITSDGVGIIWSTTGRQLATLSAVGLCVVFPHSDKLLCRVGAKGACVLSNLGVSLATLKGHSGLVTAAAVFPLENMLLTGSKDEDAIIWSALGDTIRVLRGHSGAITACSVFPNGERVVTAAEDRIVIIWSTRGSGKQFGEPLVHLHGHCASGTITGLSLFPDGSNLVTVSADKTGIIWNCEGARIADLRGHIGAITGCAVFPRSDQVLTISTDKLVVIWNGDGTRSAELHGHADVVRSCAIFPSGRHLVTTSDDMTAIIWPLSLYTERISRVRRV